LNTNLEAAEEIARQLRLRDLGGLIVIDFIDMGPQRNQRDVENRLRDAVRMDRARVQIGKITRFGLLEMSRQRLRPSLGESSYLTCPRCSGIGNIRSVESLALAILRIIGEEARKERTTKVIAQLPVEVATYLLNEKRNWVQNLESRNDTQVIMVANSALETPHYQIRRVRDDQVDLPENVGISYTLTDTDEEADVPQTIQDRKAAEPAAIAVSPPSTPAPKRKKKKEPGLFAWLAGLFGSSSKPKKGDKRRPQKRARKHSDSRGRGPQRGRRRPDSKKTAAGNKPARKKQQNKQRSKKSSADDAARKPNEARKDGRSGAKPDKQSKARDKGPDDKAREARDDSKGDGRKASSKRRSRGGRRRRRSNDDKSQTAKSGEQTSEKTEPTTPPQAEEPVVVSIVPESPVPETSAATDGKDNPPASFDDTQPELPVLDLQIDEPAQSAAPEPKDQPAPPPVEAKPEREQPASKETPEDRQKDNDADDAKPEGRLLPWEPPAPAAESVEQEKSDDDQPKQQ
jgi:ribonuclease E